MKSQTKPKSKELRCCICHELISIDPTGWMYGHNAYPYGNIDANRCCDQCNWNIVIPTRIGTAMNNDEQQQQA